MLETYPFWKDSMKAFGPCLRKSIAAAAWTSSMLSAPQSRAKRSKLNAPWTGAAVAAAAAVVVAVAAAAAAAAVVEPHKTKALVEEHPDPTYDVIGGAGGGHEFIETPNGLEDVRLSTHHGSRRASMNSDMRSRWVLLQCYHFQIQ